MQYDDTSHLRGPEPRAGGFLGPLLLVDNLLGSVRGVAMGTNSPDEFLRQPCSSGFLGAVELVLSERDRPRRELDGWE